MQQPLHSDPFSRVFRETECQTWWTRTISVCLNFVLHNLHALSLSLFGVSFRRHDRHILCWHGKWNMDCDDRSWSHDTHKTVGFFLMWFFQVSEVSGAVLFSLALKPLLSSSVEDCVTVSFSWLTVLFLVNLWSPLSVWITAESRLLVTASSCPSSTSTKQREENNPFCNFILYYTLYTLLSVFIFFILFSKHFPKCSPWEFVSQ